MVRAMIEASGSLPANIMHSSVDPLAFALG